MTMKKQVTITITTLCMLTDMSGYAIRDGIKCTGAIDDHATFTNYEIDADGAVTFLVEGITIPRSVLFHFTGAICDRGVLSKTYGGWMYVKDGLSVTLAEA